MQTKRRKFRQQKEMTERRNAKIANRKYIFGVSLNVIKAICLPTIKNATEQHLEFRGSSKTGDLSASGKQAVELGERTLDVVRWR